MKLSIISLLILGVVCICCFSTASARPGNKWRPSDPRCSGSSYRLKRSTKTNNNAARSGYWTFNSNTGSCEMQYGNKASGPSAGFDTLNECDRLCLNIYHAT